jgi:hypothetical protein
VIQLQVVQHVCCFVILSWNASWRSVNYVQNHLVQCTWGGGGGDLPENNGMKNHYVNNTQNVSSACLLFI